MTKFSRLSVLMAAVRSAQWWWVLLDVTMTPTLTMRPLRRSRQPTQLQFSRAQHSISVLLNSAHAQGHGRMPIRFKRLPPPQESLERFSTDHCGRHEVTQAFKPSSISKPCKPTSPSHRPAAGSSLTLQMCFCYPAGLDAHSEGIPDLGVALYSIYSSYFPSRAARFPFQEGQNLLKDFWLDETMMTCLLAHLEMNRSKSRLLHACSASRCTDQQH